MFPKDKDAQISLFWKKYIEKSKRYNIKQDLIRWHVKHAELYIKAHKTQLKTHAALNLDKYLQDKGRNAGLKDWQFWDHAHSTCTVFDFDLQSTLSKPFRHCRYHGLSVKTV